MEHRVNLTLSFRPEGYGIYVQRKAQLQQAGLSIAQRTTWIEMLGHRNGTQLAFETGTLNSAKSTSKFPGFWESFEKAANEAGVSVTEYDVLLRSLETRQAQQYSEAKGTSVDFSAAIAQVEAAYLVSLYRSSAAEPRNRQGGCGLGKWSSLPDAGAVAAVL